MGPASGDLGTTHCMDRMANHLAGCHQRYLHHHKPYWYEQGMGHILHHFDSPGYHVGPPSGAWTMVTQMGQCSILVTPSVRLLRALHGQPFHGIGPRPFSVLVIPVAAYRGYSATRAPVDLLDGTFACTEYAWAESKYSNFEQIGTAADPPKGLPVASVNAFLYTKLVFQYSGVPRHSGSLHSSCRLTSSMSRPPCSPCPNLLLIGA